MAITKSAKKAIRVSKRKKVYNDLRKNAAKSAVKDIRREITKKDKVAAEKLLAQAFKALDKAAKRGVLKKGNASRRKSRLAKAVAKLA